MLDSKNIQKMLSKITENRESNYRCIIKLFNKLDYTDDEEQSILHILSDSKYDEQNVFLAIKTLLYYGVNPNLVDCFDYNFIQTALYAGYSENFILNIINESLKYNLDVNHVDSDGDTIIHTAIYSDDYLGEINNIYELLCANNFDLSIEDNSSRNLLEAMIYQKQYTTDQIESFKKIFQERYSEILKDNEIQDKTLVKETPVSSNLILDEKEIVKLEKFGKILNKKIYSVSPTIGREKEIKNLMVTLAQDKKSPLIVGESGVGKTAIVEELAFRIKTGQAPQFLKDKLILEINPSDVVAGCTYVGEFEEKMTKLMNLCEKNDVIVFIDEMHTIYGVGSTKGKDNDMSSMLKYYVDRSNLKVIGTTTQEEYNEYFSKDALKRRFEKIKVLEPTEDLLYKIVNKVINDYYIKSGIEFENENIKNEIIKIIIEATKKSHRKYDDIVNNPDLSISIIDKAFAFAKFYDSDFITCNHFIESFSYCDRIYESTIEQAISKLKQIKPNKIKNPQKILKLIQK